MKNKLRSGNFGSFIVLAIIIMLATDHFILNGNRPYIEAVKTEGLFKNDNQITTPSVNKKKAFQEFNNSKNEEIKKARLIGPFLGVSSDPSKPIISEMPNTNRLPVHKVHLPEAMPKWKKHAVAAYPPDGWAKIAIIIDDMGMNVKQSNRAINLNGPLTLAFLPYAENISTMINRARTNGHELLVHVPMEANNDELELGNIALHSNLNDEEFSKMLSLALQRFEGYVGINNHMGSKLTRDKEAMTTIMDELKRRGLLFVDSRTINTSVAADIAKDKNVPFAVRDVFLDHEPNQEFVEQSLKKLENVAYKNGFAIGIGHPKKITISVLKEWITTLEKKKIALVPVSHIVDFNQKKYFYDNEKQPSQMTAQQQPE
jgi:polysaccharide deacetylase 2 family uncharacterized protein YibQ